MAAAHLKKVGTGPCLPLCSISFSWSLIVWEVWRPVAGVLGEEFFSGEGFPADQQRIFHLMMRQMFSVCERTGLHQFSTWPLLLRRHTVVMDVVCCLAL